MLNAVRAAASGTLRDLGRCPEMTLFDMDAAGLIHTYGLWVLFGFVFLESTGIPLPFAVSPTLRSACSLPAAGASPIALSTVGCTMVWVSEMSPRRWLAIRWVMSLGGGTATRS